MKTVSVAVLDSDYEAFRQAAAARNRSFDDLIREAMALYRVERLENREPLMDLPVLSGPRLVKDLPSRSAIWQEIFESDQIR